MTEIWKDIEGYEGYFQVSNLGRVKSLKRTIIIGGINEYEKPEIILRPSTSKRGVKSVTLSKDGVAKTFRVHRLVAEVFLPNIYDLPCINHKDEDPSNNNVDNLEWCTWQYNSRYGTAVERTQEKRFLKRGYMVVVIDSDGNIIGEYKSGADAAKALNMSPSAISIALNGSGNIRKKRRVEKRPLDDGSGDAEIRPWEEGI